MQEESVEGGGKREVALAIVTSQQFIELTGDDRIMYKALLTHLEENYNSTHDEGDASTEKESIKSPRVDIVVWDDPTVDWTQYACCIIRSPWDYTQKYEQFLEWLERVRLETQIYNDYNTMKWNSHKRYLLDLAENTDVAVVPTVLYYAGEATTDTIEETMLSKRWDYCVLKPAVGSFGNDVILVKSADLNKRNRSQNQKLVSHIQTMLTSRDMLLQPFQPSVKTRGEMSLIFVDSYLAHAIKKKPSQGDFKVQGGKVEAYQPSEKEIQTAEAALEASWRCIHNKHQKTTKTKTDKNNNKQGKKKNNNNNEGYKRDAFLFGRVDLLSSNSGDLLVSEMEILDPELFFRLSPSCVEKFCNAITSKLEENSKKQTTF